MVSVSTYIITYSSYLGKRGDHDVQEDSAYSVQYIVPHIYIKNELLPRTPVRIIGCQPSVRRRTVNVDLERWTKPAGGLGPEVDPVYK